MIADASVGEVANAARNVRRTPVPVVNGRREPLIPPEGTSPLRHVVDVKALVGQTLRAVRARMQRRVPELPRSSPTFQPGKKPSGILPSNIRAKNTVAGTVIEVVEVVAEAGIADPSRGAIEEIVLSNRLTAAIALPGEAEAEALTVDPIAAEGPLESPRSALLCTKIRRTDEVRRVHRVRDFSVGFAVFL